MTSIPKAKLKQVSAGAIVFWLVLLVACAPSRDIGIDAIARDGQWATIVEHSGEPPTWSLVRLDLVSGETTEVATGTRSGFESGFSPDGRYVLFLALDGWMLTDTTTWEQVRIADEDENVQFLPDGKLLVRSSDDNLAQFYTIDNLGEPQIRTLIVDQVRYVFSNQRPESSTDTCARQPAYRSSLWTMVNANGGVFVVHSTPDGISTRGLATNISEGVTDLLDRQAAAISASLASAEEQLRETIRQQATVADEVLDEEELELSVKEQIREFEASLIDLTVFGTLSPDGATLLFERIVGITSDDLLASLYNPDADSSENDLLFSLYLIDLKTGEAEHPLSTETT